MTRRFPYQQPLGEQSTFRYLALYQWYGFHLYLLASLDFSAKLSENLVWSIVAITTLKLLARLKNEIFVLASFDLTSLLQTLYVNDEVLLCDCPGLVFPSFVSTKAEMILNGILPIDQMRDHVPAVSLISFSIVQPWFRAGYMYSLCKCVVVIHTTRLNCRNRQLISHHKDDTDKPVVLLTFCNSQAINVRLGQLVMKTIERHNWF